MTTFVAKFQTTKEFLCHTLTGSTTRIDDKALAKMDLDCVFEKRTCVAFLGPTGQGKSILIQGIYQLLTGLNNPVTLSQKNITNSVTKKVLWIPNIEKITTVQNRPNLLIPIETPGITITTSQNIIEHLLRGKWRHGQPMEPIERGRFLSTVKYLTGELIMETYPVDRTQGVDTAPKCVCIVINFEPGLEESVKDNKDLRMAAHIAKCVTDLPGLDIIPIYVVTGIDRATEKSFWIWKKLAKTILCKENWDSGVYYVATSGLDSTGEDWNMWNDPLCKEYKYALYRLLKCLKDQSIGK